MLGVICKQRIFLFEAGYFEAPLHGDSGNVFSSGIPQASLHSFYIFSPSFLSLAFLPGATSLFGSLGVVSCRVGFVPCAMLAGHLPAGVPPSPQCL